MITNVPACNKSDIKTYLEGAFKNDNVEVKRVDFTYNIKNIRKTRYKLKAVEKSLEWARNFVEISEEDEKNILQAKKSILFNEKTHCVKKGVSDSYVAQGSYDGAETCEIVGLYLLSKISV